MRSKLIVFCFCFFCCPLVQYGDREALELWSSLQLKIDKFFTGIEVKPSLIHGDLWSGNIGQTATCPGEEHLWKAIVMVCVGPYKIIYNVRILSQGRNESRNVLSNMQWQMCLSPACSLQFMLRN